MVNRYSQFMISPDGVVEDSSSEVEDSTSRKVEDSTSSKVEDSTSSKVEDSTSSKVEDSTSSKVEDSTSRKVEDSASSKVEDSTSRKVEDSASRKVEDSTSSKVVDSTGRKVESSTKAVGGYSSIKIRKASHEKMTLLSMATGDSQQNILDQAINQIFEQMAIENPKVKAFQVLINDFQAPDPIQTTIEDFM